MSGGYYEPGTPSVHPLSEDEFGKVVRGTITSLTTGWATYLGIDRVRRVLFRVANSYRSWSYAEGHALDLEVGDDPWSFAELEKACEIAVTGYCLAWSAYVGVDAVLRELRGLLDEGDWQLIGELSQACARALIEADEREAAEASGKAN